MKTVYIIRDTIGRKQSTGAHLVINEKGDVVYDGQILELGWLNNRRNISCIPEGIYELRLERSPKFKRKLWEAYGVPNRSETKFHNGVTYKHSNGCFIPGKTRFDLNADNLDDMINSRDALEEFHDAMGEDTRARLVIINDRQN
ncbi:MAG: DUF5675 family protein [Flavobacteriaceae bacterium]